MGRGRPAPATDARSPSPFYEEARAAVGAEEEVAEEELFGPAEDLYADLPDACATSCSTASRRSAAGWARCGSTPTSTWPQAVARYLELLKLAALIERHRDGQDARRPRSPRSTSCSPRSPRPSSASCSETPTSTSCLRDAERDDAPRAAAGSATRAEPSLEAFIPRRGDGLMLSATDIEIYRICPLQYKFARVFRIPQEQTLQQRFGILVHQVLERFHAADGRRRSLERR